MARINSNISSLIAQANLTRSNQELQLRLERLATGLRINRGSDDPAGLITSERIRADLEGVSQGITNAERASSVISTTEASLAEVSDLLNSIKSLIVEAANTGANSKDERSANQLQIDSAIDSITRISNTASFGGLKLLNGELDYTLSGLAASAISVAQIFGASFVGVQSLQVDVDVVNSAQVGALYLRGDVGTPPGLTVSATKLEIAGNRGVSVIEITAQRPLSAIVTGVNAQTSLTGVRAELLNPTDMSSGIVFKSVDFGSDSFISVRRLEGDPPPQGYFQTFKLDANAPVPASPPFPWAALLSAGTLTTGERDTGLDVTALVNGTVATGDGLRVKINSQALSLDLALTEDLGTRPNQSTSFFVTGGGALFQLGQDVTAQQQVNLGIGSVAASKIGGSTSSGTLQFLDSLKDGQSNSIRASVERGDFTAASDILSRAIDDVAILRGRLGAFERNVLGTTERSLQSSFENLSASLSSIRDADFAFETSKLTRAQILVSAGNTVLGLANQQSQQVLQLLG